MMSTKRNFGKKAMKTMNEGKMFTIKTDDGGKFCDCVIEDGEVTYIAKEGNIKLTSLMSKTFDQTANSCKGRRGRKLA